MEPAKSIVETLGGPAIVARALGLTTGAVMKWSRPIALRGAGGIIPSRHIVALCKLARDRGGFLEPNQFFRGHV